MGTNSTNDFQERLLFKGCLFCSCFLIFCGAFYNLYVDWFTGIGYLLPMFICAMFFFAKKNLLIRYDKCLLWYTIWFVQFICIREGLLVPFAEQDVLGIRITAEVYSVVQNFLVLMLGLQLQEKDEWDNVVLKILIVSLVCNMFYTLRALAINPNISKIMAVGSIGKYTSDNTFGVVGYTYIYAIIFLVPVLLAGIKLLDGKKKRFCWIILAVLLYFAVKTGYFTAIILILILFFLFKFFDIRPSAKFLCLLGMFVVVAFWLNPLVVAKFFYSLGMTIKVETISARCFQITDFLINGNKGAALVRMDLVLYAFVQFLKSPIWGSAFSNEYTFLSRHSDFLDILASGGILHFLPYALFVQHLYKKIRDLFQNEVLKNTVKTVFVGYYILGFINTVFVSNAIMLIITGILPVTLRLIKKHMKRGE